MNYINLVMIKIVTNAIKHINVHFEHFESIIWKNKTTEIQQKCTKCLNLLLIEACEKCESISCNGFCNI